MIVYHGSVLAVDKPDTIHSYRPLDFGKGFYVTSVREQAERWARRKADLLGKDRAIISVYEMKENVDGLLVKSFDPDLMEFNNGLLAGLSHEEADRLYPHVENLPIDQAVYGQESKVEFRSRAENALQRVLSENGSESVIAIVTHGGMVNQLYGALLHMPIGENRFFRTADTGIHIWEITERGSYVIKANMDDHIRGI